MDGEVRLKAKLYHNPACSTSRRVLDEMRDAGIQVEIVEYLKRPPAREVLRKIYADAGLSPRDGLRSRVAAAAALSQADGEAILEAMESNPALIERPILVIEKGARLCRPAERWREIA